MEELDVEILDAEAAAAHVAEWGRLAADCLEPNGFLEPGFALPAARHLAKHRPPHFLFVWDGSRRLLGVCPLERPGRLQARVWTHEQAPLGTPLLDRERAEEALAAIFAFCREHWPKVVGLMFPSLPQDGPTARLLIALANAEGRSVRRFAVYRRACSLAARTRSMTSNDRFGQSDGKTSIERAGGFRPRAPCASAC